MTVDGSGVIRSRVHSRIGLLGNPSDGFGGACISLSLANFHAEVRERQQRTGRDEPLLLSTQTEGSIHLCASAPASS